VLRLHKREEGQTFGEYAILVGGIAVVCGLVLVILALAIRGLLGGSDDPSRPAPLLPPTRPSQLAYPTRIEECENGGWRNYVQFRNEAECRRYVEGLRP
jgi:hypothetical protein